MRRVELARVIAAVAPGLDPVTVPVSFRDAGIDVTITDEDIAGWVEGHIRWLPEPSVLGGQWRRRMFQWTSGFVRRFLLAPEHHGHTTFRIEPDDHIRPFVDRPDVVLFIDAYCVSKRPSIEILADLTNELAIRSEFLQLRSTRG